MIGLIVFLTSNLSKVELHGLILRTMSAGHILHFEFALVMLCLPDLIASLILASVSLSWT